MASHAAHALASNFDESDPHGGTPHTHVIVPPITLKLILGALLFFTVLTVATAQLEVWIMDYFHILLPAWLNVAGAMAIATVKAILVMAYFMQLRYDNPMNTVIMLFCFFAVGLFLMFTSIDLFTRDLIYKDKGTYVVEGGTFGGDKPLATMRREEWMTKWGPEKYAQLKAGLAHHAHGHEEAGGKSGGLSGGLSGITGALSTTSPAEHGHGDSHGTSKHDEVHQDTMKEGGAPHADPSKH